MRVKSLVITALAGMALAGCSALESEIVTHMETTKIRELEHETGETRFSSLGEDTLKLVCKRTEKTAARCYTMPANRNNFASCTVYDVTRKTGFDFGTLLAGKLNVVRGLGPLQGPRCPRR